MISFVYVLNNYFWDPPPPPPVAKSISIRNEITDEPSLPKAAQSRYI
jgi:hypothetical protein